MTNSEQRSANVSSVPTNIVIVMTTQWRASALGFAGDLNARTPGLDRLAADSLWFSQAVTPHPFGVFARAAFLTGRRCPDNGVLDYFDPLPSHATCLPHAFQRIGWDTAFFGKWQLYRRDPTTPVVGEAHARIVVPSEHRAGFRYWEGFESGFLLNDPFLHGTAIPEPRQFRGYQSEVLVDRFIGYAQRREEKAPPLFALVSLDPPHPPYAAPAAGVQPRDPDSLRLLDSTSPDPAIRAVARRELAGYYAHIEATDRAVARLVSFLRSSQRYAESLVVFASAHGDMHGAHGLFRKGWPHEESVRVPLLLSWPGVLAGGLRSDALVSLLDLGPALLRLAGGWVSELGGSEQAGAAFCDVLLSGATGPSHQELSMPSVPPFAKQCPYAWTARRDAAKTLVQPEEGEPFTLWHPQEWVFKEPRPEGRQEG